MSGKKITPARKQRASLKLSAPDNLRDLLALLADESSVEVVENADDLINHGVGLDNAAIYQGQLPNAVRAVERGEAHDPFATDAYDTLAGILARVRGSRRWKRSRPTVSGRGKRGPPNTGASMTRPPSRRTSCPPSGATGSCASSTRG